MMIPSAILVQRLRSTSGLLGIWLSMSLLTVLCGQGAILAGETIFRGRILYDGTPPPIMKFTNLAELAVCGGDPTDDSLIVDAETRGVANVFVYLPRGEMVTDTTDHAAEVPSPPVRVISSQCRLFPRCALLQRNQPLVFSWEDVDVHHLRPYGFTNLHVDRKILSEQIHEFRFEHAERLPMRVSCDIHPWMQGWWLVLDHPFAAITNARGEFEIRGLPAGDHTLIVWHELTGYIRKAWQISVAADEQAPAAEIRVSPSAFQRR